MELKPMLKCFPEEACFPELLTLWPIQRPILYGMPKPSQSAQCIFFLCHCMSIKNLLSHLCLTGVEKAKLCSAPQSWNSPLLEWGTYPSFCTRSWTRLKQLQVTGKERGGKKVGSHVCHYVSNAAPFLVQETFSFCNVVKKETRMLTCTAINQGEQEFLLWKGMIKSQLGNRICDY